MTMTKEEKLARKLERKKAREQEMISVIKLDVIKPLNMTWEEARTVLNKIRYVGHRVMNDVMRMCILAYLSKTGKTALGPLGEDLHTAAYREAGKRIAECKEHIEDLSISSNVQNAWTGHAFHTYSSRLKDMLKGEMSIPSYRKGSPIMLLATGWSLSRDSKGYVLSVALMEGRSGRVSFAVACNGGRDHGSLREFIAGVPGVRQGDMKLVFNPKANNSQKNKEKRCKGGGWEAHITIARPKPPPLDLDPDRKLAVHRGMTCLLTYATDDGKEMGSLQHVGPMGILDYGKVIKDFKDQMASRRQGFYRRRRKYSKRSRGRGYWNRYEQYRALEDKEACFVKKHMELVACDVLALAKKRGCGTIVMDDWSARELANEVESKDGNVAAWFIRRWPFGAQREAIEKKLANTGIKVEIVESAGESITCPSCRNIDPSQVKAARRPGEMAMFHCANPSCDFVRGVEFVAAWNMLHQAGKPEAYQNANEVLAAKIKGFRAVVAGVRRRWRASRSVRESCEWSRGDKKPGTARISQSLSLDRMQEQDILTGATQKHRV